MKSRLIILYIENLIEWTNNIKIENINENDYFITYYIASVSFIFLFEIIEGSVYVFQNTRDL